MSQPVCLPVSVKAVCRQLSGRVLLCRNHRGEWELPGGRPETGEDHETCLIRELAEETGLVVQVGTCVGERRFEVLPGRWVTLVAYRCAALSTTDCAHPRVSDEHTAVGFHDPETVTGLPEVYRELIATAVATG